MQIITWSFHLTPVRMAKLNKRILPDTGGWQEKRTLFTLGGTAIIINQYVVHKNYK